MDKSRLFVGTFLDAEQAFIVAKLKQMNGDLSQIWSLKARFVPLPKLHLTWLFIGDVEQDRIDDVKTDLTAAVKSWKENAKNSEFQIKYDRIEVWSSLKMPRVLVLESTSDCPPAESLHSAITKPLAKYLQKSDNVPRFKRFRPHLTVCRFSPDTNQRGGGKARRQIEDFKTPEDLLPVVQNIATVSLIKSDLNAGPNGYASILDLPL